jgi:hypothetical protein
MDNKLLKALGFVYWTELKPNLVIDKNSFLSFLNKLKEKGIKEVKVSKVFIDGYLEDDLKVLKIKDIEKLFSYKIANMIYYNTEEDKIVIYTLRSLYIEINDENFDELKEMVKVNYMIEEL